MRVEKIIPLRNSEWISLTLDHTDSLNVEKTIILCHGLSGEKIGPQRLLTLLAENFARKCGTQVLRFDFRGSGLSSGDFADTTFDSMLEDALFVAKSLQEVIWMGISTGALIALMASAERRKREKVFSISNGLADWVDPALNIEENGMVSIREGQFYLPEAFFAARKKLAPRKNYFPYCPSISCVLGSEDKKHVCEAPSLLREKAGVHVIQGADHLFTNPYKRKELITYLTSIL